MTLASAAPAAPVRIVADHDVPAAFTQDWPPLSDIALHGTAGEVVRGISEQTGLNPAIVLGSFLTYAAPYLGANAVLAIGDDHYQPRLFTVLTGGDGARNARAIRYAREFFSTAAALAGPRRFPPAVVRQVALLDGEDFVQSIYPSSDQDPATTGTDNAPHFQGLLLEAQDFGMTWRKACHLNNSLGTLLKLAFEGAELPASLSGKGQVSYKGQISLIGHASEGELQGPEPGSSRWHALAPCILWVYYKAAPSHALPRPIKDTFKKEVTGKLASAMKFADKTNWICLSPDAETACAELYKDLSLQALSSPSSAGAYCGSMHLLRLASTFSLLDETSIVEPVHLHAAMEFLRYCFHSAQLLFYDATSDDIADQVLKALAQGPKTQTELHSVFSRNLKGAHLNRVLTDLLTKGLITATKVLHRGRPTIIWKLAAATGPDLHNRRSPR